MTLLLGELRGMSRASDPVIDVLERWHQAIEAGVANTRRPDLDHKESVVSKSKVDNLIEQVDDYFIGELKMHHLHWERKGLSEPPDFGRLEGGARLAFYQDLVEVVKDITDEDLLEDI